MTKTFDKISVYRLYQKQKSIDVPRIYLEYATHKKERKEEYTTAKLDYIKCTLFSTNNLFFFFFFKIIKLKSYN